VGGVKVRILHRLVLAQHRQRSSRQELDNTRTKRRKKKKKGT
jgi:hypothetical protein